MMLSVQDFIECFAAESYEKKKEILSRSNPVNKNVSGSVYLCIADMEAEFPVCTKIIDDEQVQLPDVVRGCDYYVTNRCLDNLKAVEWAYLLGKKVLSGVDIPVWTGNI